VSKFLDKQDNPIYGARGDPLRSQLQQHIKRWKKLDREGTCAERVLNRFAIQSAANQRAAQRNKTTKQSKGSGSSSSGDNDSGSESSSSISSKSESKLQRESSMQQNMLRKQRRSQHQSQSQCQSQCSRSVSNPQRKKSSCPVRPPRCHTPSRQASCRTEAHVVGLLASSMLPLLCGRGKTSHSVFSSLFSTKRLST